MTVRTRDGLEPRPVPALRRTVSAIGGGCWPLGGPCTNDDVPMGWSAIDDDTAITALRAAYLHGVTMFDTADVYGHGLSEQRLGRFLAGVPRDRVVISSKVGYVRGDGPHPYAPAQMRRQLEQSLSNLGTDYLDIYALHSADFGPNDAYLDDAVAQMREFREVGLVRAIGMRAPHEFAVEWATDLDDQRGRDAARFLRLFHQVAPDVITTRYNLAGPTYRPGDTTILDLGRQQGITVLLKQVLGQGVLINAYHPSCDRGFDAGDHRAGKATFGPTGLGIAHEQLRPLRERFGHTPSDLARVAIRFCLQTAPDAIILLGFRNASQIETNLSCLGDPLTADDIEHIRRAGQALHTASVRASASSSARS